MARPTKLTPERVQIICDCFAKGYTLAQSAHAARIGERTLRNWLTRAKEADPDSDWGRLHAARMLSENALLNRLDRGDTETRTVRSADGDIVQTIEIKKESWKMAAWMLERRFPDKYANRSTLSIEPAVELDTETIPEAFLEAFRNKGK